MILAGNFNARRIYRGCSSENPFVKLVFKYLHDTYITVNFPNSPNRFLTTYTTKSILDNTLVKSNSRILKMLCIQALFLDLLPVFFTLYGE